jgi:hypothetical protein
MRGMRGSVLPVSEKLDSTMRGMRGCVLPVSEKLDSTMRGMRGCVLPVSEKLDSEDFDQKNQDFCGLQVDTSNLKIDKAGNYDLDGEW